MGILNGSGSIQEPQLFIVNLPFDVLTKPGVIEEKNACSNVQLNFENLVGLVVCVRVTWVNCPTILYSIPDRYHTVIERT